MSTTTKTLGLAALVAAMLAIAAPAQAQPTNDFASCSGDLVACDANTDNCCYRPFDPVAADRAIIIPMDRCHQVVAQSGKYAPPAAAAPAWCTDAGPYSSNDDGLYHSYGLVYRLMQHGIPVYWLINPTKDAPALTINQNANSQTYIARDIDFWVTSPGASPPTGTSSLAACNGTCVDPVQRLSPTTLAPVANSYNATAFPVRGSAFVIAPEDRARFNAFWKKTGEFAALAGNSYYSFNDVDLYEVNAGAKIVYQDFRTTGPAYTLGAAGNGAPVAVRIDYAPPRLARQSPAGVSQIWLGLANLDQPADYPACLSGNFTPSDAVYCGTTLSDIQNGALVNGGFNWAWIDNWSDNTPCSTAAETATVDALETFMGHEIGVRAGGHIVFMEAVINVMEKCAGKELMGKAGVGLTAMNTAPSEPLILRRPANLFMQWGDLPTSFAQGAVTKWSYWGNGAEGYDPSHVGASGTLVRLVSEDRSATGNTLCTQHRSSGACDVYGNTANSDNVDVSAYVRYQDDPANGIAFYMPGNQVNNGPSQLRMILDTLITLPLATVPQTPNTRIAEVTRSAPVVATVGGQVMQYQGSYVVTDPSPVIPTYSAIGDGGLFEFPYTKGHYRGINSAGTVQWDAATQIPAANPSGCGTWFTSSCRTVFTNGATGRNPARVFLSTANRSMLGPQLGATLDNAALDLLISRLLAGHKNGTTWEPALGGIDRSNAAVIEPSPIAGTARPTIAYVGATDGMMHAICVDTVAPCQNRGQELWAFAPRAALGRLRFNEGNIDGSPKVADVFGDFAGTGFRAWRTVLTFQLGSGEPGIAGRAPAVYALDVTNPSDPQILWEYAAPSTPSTVDLGVGLNVAMGPTQINGVSRNLTIVETNNGGSGGPGVYTVAIDTESGSPVWTFSKLYPAPRNSASPAVPDTGVPGGVAAFDHARNGSFTHVAVPTLYGEVWMLDATTGQSVYGNTPVFSFGSDFHPLGAPPTVYYDHGDGALSLAVASGGYVDPLASSWAPAAEHQYVVGFAALPPASLVPIRDSGVNTSRRFTVDLGAGERAYGQAVVSGNEIYVVTDAGDVNDPLYGVNELNTATVRRISLSSGNTVSSQTIAVGAASVDVQGGVVHAGNGTTTATLDYTSTFDSTGEGTELATIVKLVRMLWIRTQ